jgi:hypothetical protein
VARKERFVFIYLLYQSIFRRKSDSSLNDYGFIPVKAHK